MGMNASSATPIPVTSSAANTAITNTPPTVATAHQPIVPQSTPDVVTLFLGPGILFPFGFLLCSSPSLWPIFRSREPDGCLFSLPFFLSLRGVFFTLESIIGLPSATGFVNV